MIKLRIELSSELFQFNPIIKNNILKNIIKFLIELSKNNVN